MKKIMNIMLLLIMIVIFIMSLAMISTAEGKAIKYKSTRNGYKSTEHYIPFRFSYLVNNFIEKNEKYDSKNLYFVLDNYDIYKYLGFTNKSKSFFNNNLLIVNGIMSGVGVSSDNYINTGVTINNGILNISYTHNRKLRDTNIMQRVVDVIELKKSDVEGIDLTKEIVTVRDVYTTSKPEDVQRPDTYTTIEMVYVDAEKLIQKPDKVKKVKVKLLKKKQLKVSWKKINGVKYKVKYSLKKGMKNAKTKKNIKKNKVILKKLKSGKKYYIKVRAYKKIGNKTYTGKWSKKVSRKVK